MIAAQLMDMVQRGPRALHAAGINLAPLAQKAGGFAGMLSATLSGWHETRPLSAER